MLPLVAIGGIVYKIAAILLFILLSLVGIAILIGVPAYVGYIVFQTSRDKELFNPAAFGFIAGFFAFLLLAFLAGLVGMFAT